MPAWAVDRVIEYWPERCGCGHIFAEGERLVVGEPVRWQVEELPVTQVQITEHRAQRVRCPGCGEQTRRELPGEVTQSAFGPRFQAAVATLCTRNRHHPGPCRLRGASRSSFGAPPARALTLSRAP